MADVRALPVVTTDIYITSALTVVPTSAIISYTHTRLASYEQGELHLIFREKKLYDGTVCVFSRERLTECLSNKVN